MLRFFFVFFFFAFAFAFAFAMYLPPPTKHTYSFSLVFQHVLLFISIPCLVNTAAIFTFLFPLNMEMFHFYPVTLSLIEHAAAAVNGIDFPFLLQYDLVTLHCLSISLFSPPLPPQYFIRLCPRLSFRVLWQGLLRGLPLPKRRRL